MFKNKLFIGILALLLAAMACNAPGTTVVSEADIEATLTKSELEEQLENSTLPEVEDAVEGVEPEPEVTPEVVEQEANIEAPIVPIDEPVVQEEQSVCDYDSGFVADVTIPDGTVIDAGEPFTKTWRLSNNGCHPWANVSLAYVSGTPMSGPSQVPVNAIIAPNQSADISVDLIAPSAPGVYEVTYQLQSEGSTFGVQVYANIVVPEPVDEATPVPEVTEEAPPVEPAPDEEEEEPTPEPEAQEEDDEEEPEPTPEPDEEEDDDNDNGGGGFGGVFDGGGILACFYDIEFPNGNTLHLPKGSTIAPITVKNMSNCDWLGEVTVEHQDHTNFMIGGQYEYPPNSLVPAGHTTVMQVPILAYPKPNGVIDMMTVRIRVGSVLIEKDLTIIYHH